MSTSARIFACFVDWCAGAGLNASDYRITITPLSPEADARLQSKWRNDWEHLRYSGPAYPAPRDPKFNEGFIMAVPFKIDTRT